MTQATRTPNTKPLRRALLYTAVCLSIVGTTTSACAGVFDTPKEEIVRDVHKIDILAYGPVRAPYAKRVSTQLETMARASLQARGYEIAEAGLYHATREDISRKLGGVFDPVTGRYTEEQIDIARQHVLSEMRSRHDVNARLVVWVTEQTTRPSSEWGAYIGIDAPLMWYGSKISSSSAVLRGHANAFYPTTIEATFVNVSLEDLEGRRLYAATTPLQWTKVYMMGSRYVRPAAELFTDKQALQSAIDHMLEPLSR